MVTGLCFGLVVSRLPFCLCESREGSCKTADVQAHHIAPEAIRAIVFLIFFSAIFNLISAYFVYNIELLNRYI